MAWLEAGKRVELSERIRRSMAAKGWTQARLAKQAGYDERTIRNVLNGQSTRPETILDICEALEMEFENLASDYGDVAAEQYGSYARKSVMGYSGSYFGYRRVFSRSRKIMRTCYSIMWSEGKGRLVFAEHQKYRPADQCPSKPSHAGDVYIGTNTNLVHLVTVFQGAVRLVTLTKMREEALRGVVLTQGERPAFYQPAVSALLLRKVDSPIDEGSFYAKVGLLASDDPEYQRINSELREIEADVIFFAQSQDA